MPETGHHDHDPQRVSLASNSAAAYWARRFQVFVERLAEAVRMDGDDPAHVAARLGVARPDGFDGIT